MLLAGFDNSEDAAVYQIDDKRSIINTLDFFTPIVDDPYDFGQIAAANSLSDVYAMGGTPKLCMNIVCFPDDLDIEILKQILLGGADKVKEAGALLVGGHSIKDKEPKYGLSVTGFVETKRFLANSTARVGDILILTKPIGTGIISTGVKTDSAKEEWAKASSFSMKQLNKYAVESFEDILPHSATDVTGFGLIGHLQEMMSGAHLTAELSLKDIPMLEGAIELAEMGCIPGGNFNNRRNYEHDVSFENTIKESEKAVLFDPQTSGGLLIAVAEEDADELVKRLRERVTTPIGVIGRVIEGEEKRIIVRRG